MAKTAKRTIAVQKIYDDMDELLVAFSKMGKNPNKLYLTSKQYAALVADRNKGSDKLEQVMELPPYRGYSLTVYNP